jgi:hypothetical protein
MGKRKSSISRRAELEEKDNEETNKTLVLYCLQSPKGQRNVISYASFQNTMNAPPWELRSMAQVKLMCWHEDKF